MATSTLLAPAFLLKWKGLPAGISLVQHPRLWSCRRFFTATASSPSSGAQMPEEQESPQPSRNLWKMDAAKLRAKVATLGLAAVLAYGLFDGITYTTFFILAFLGYEKSTGQNPTANLKSLLGIVILMWTGNNVTRPFRVAGAAALAPLLDPFLKKIQKILDLPNKAFAFMLVVVCFVSSCFSVVGLLILSRWGK